MAADYPCREVLAPDKVEIEWLALMLETTTRDLICVRSANSSPTTFPPTTSTLLAVASNLMSPTNSSNTRAILLGISIIPPRG